ncbi:MAG: LytR/AlgR family response regulator transcription factor [Saprospiraceae bacterium]
MKKKIQCYILDDEPLAIKVIEQYLSKFEQFEICGTSTEPIEAHQQLKILQTDLLFLDIEMPDMNGLELIDSMQSQPQIIITTAYREYAVEGFELNVLDYLVKPIPFPRFVKAIDKFLKLQKPKIDSKDNNTITNIFIKANRKNVRIELNDILYIEGLKDYVKIVLANQSFLTKHSIGNFHKTLPPEQFLRIHKSFVIAKNKVSAFTSHDVEIGQIELPIGRQFKEEFINKMK